MQQLFAVLLATVLIPVLLRKNLSVGTTLLILSPIAGLVGGLGVPVIVDIFVNIFITSSILSAVIIVVEIALLGKLMAHYGLLAKAELQLKKAIPNSKIIIMLMPAMIGMIQAPGGAALSAPFVDNLGSEMKISPNNRSNLNVICRHVAILIMPFSTSILIVKGFVPDLNVGLLILMNFGFVLAMQGAGYFFILRKAESIEIEKAPAAERLSALLGLCVTLSPILVIIGLNLFFGINYAISSAVAILWVFVLGGREEFAKQVVKSFDFNILTMIVGVYFFQGIVTNSTELIDIMTSWMLNSSEFMLLFLILFIATLFGLVTGLYMMSLGILVPILLSMTFTSDAQLTVYIFYTFVCSFVGYYFSPIHLCQLLTDKHVGCPVSERYKAYMPVLISMVVSPVLLFFVYGVIFA